MDTLNGKKVLDRLIILFIVINLILGTVNIVSSRRRYVISNDRVDNLYTVLKKDKVVVESELPLDFKPRPSVNVVYEISTPSMRDAIIRTIFKDSSSPILRSTEKSEEYQGITKYQFKSGDEKISFEKHNVEYINDDVDKTAEGIDEELANKYMYKFIKRMGIQDLYKESYIEYEEMDNYISIKYYPVIDGICLDDIYITMDVYKDGISAAKFPLTRIEYIESSYREVIPVDRVLFGIDKYINSIPGVFLPEIFIENIRIVYKKQNPESFNLWGEKNIPMYKLNINGLEEPIFVNACTNEYIKW